jgi:hypothetical protein
VDDWGLVPEDDMFHPPESDDTWWTETVWFAWNVPERNLLGYFYPAFRANIGVQFGGVLVVDDSATLPWELPAFDWTWHQPIAQPPDLLDGTFLDRLVLQCMEPGRVFRFAYEGEDLRFDLTYDALMRPLLSRREPPFDFGAHIDQPGHVTGTMWLGDDEVAVDCYAMRDRSWGIRRPGRQPKIGYCYGTVSADDAFLSISVDRKGHDGVIRGFLQREGTWSELVGGTRSVERDAQGRPALIRVEATDALGRELVATGRSVSRQVFTAYPHMFCWNSLVHWELDGVPCWGEDQDVWHPRAWRRHAQATGVLTT